MALQALVRPACIKTNKNELDIDGGNSIGGDRIDNKMVNLSSSIKKMSSKAGFFISKTCLAFIQLRKVFIKTLILYHFDSKHHNWIETDTLSHAISELLSQLTTKKLLVYEMIHKTNDQLINLLSKIY